MHDKNVRGFHLKKVNKNRVYSRVIIDYHYIKSNPFTDGSSILLVELIRNFYYNIGNAGVYIAKTKYIPTILNEYSYNFFNNVLPRTQVMILAAMKNGGDHFIVKYLNISAPGLHGNIKAYTSYYIWRTTYFDLHDCIEKIKDKIDSAVYSATKEHLKQKVNQVFLNIL